MRFIEEIIASNEINTSEWMVVQEDPFMTCWENINYSNRLGVGPRYVATNSVWYTDKARDAVVLKRIYPLGHEQRCYTADGALKKAYDERPMWDSEGPNNKPRDWNS